MNTDTATADAVAPEIRLLRLGSLLPHPQNPRNAAEMTTTAPKIKALARSVRTTGHIDPLLVRPHPVQATMFQVVSGHRRRVACLLNAVQVVPCIVEELDDDACVALMLAVEVQHDEVDLLGKAAAVAMLAARPGWSLKLVADHLGETERWVACHANMNRLIPDLKARVGTPEFKHWTPGWWDHVARLRPQDQERLAKLAHVINLGYCRTATAVASFVAPYSHMLDAAPWPLDDATLVPVEGSCTTCTRTSLAQAGLFDVGDEPQTLEQSRCLDSECWKAKTAAHNLQRLDALSAQHEDALLVHGDESLREDTGWLEGRVVMKRHDWAPAKKSDPGARKAIVATGKGAGKTRYVKPVSDAAERRARTVGGKKITESADTTDPAKLAKSRAKIVARREAHVVEAVRTEAAALEQPPAFDVLCGLVAAYGVRSNTPGKFWHGPDRMEAFDATTGDDSGKRVLCPKWAAVVWPRVRSYFPERLAFTGKIAPAPVVAEARWLGRVLLLDLVAKEAAALKAIPDPKFWAAAETRIAADKQAKLKATPKGKGKAKAKPKATDAFGDGVLKSETVSVPAETVEVDREFMDKLDAAAPKPETKDPNKPWGGLSPAERRAKVRKVVDRSTADVEAGSRSTEKAPAPAPSEAPVKKTVKKQPPKLPAKKRAKRARKTVPKTKPGGTK